MGGIVEVDGGCLRGLYGVLGLQVSLLQRDGRQSDFAVRDVCEFGVQVDPHGDRGSDLVRVEALEGFAYVGLLADDVERGHGLADGADVDVLVRVTFVLFGDVVRVEHGQILIASLLCQTDVVRVAVQDAAGVSFLIADCGEDQVAFEVLDVLGDEFHDRHDGCVACLHVEQAAAEDVFAGFEVSLRRGRQFDLLELLHQFERAVRILLQITIVGDTDVVDVSDHDDRLLRVALFTLQNGGAALSAERVVLDGNEIQVFGMLLPVIHTGEDLVDLVRRIDLARGVDDTSDLT